MTLIAINLLTGAIFGSGLTLSGVASPQVIKDQFRLSDFHMLATFLTASASSAAVFAAYNSRPSDKKIMARASTSHGWFNNFDGNMIGGAMVGLGMSLTGACPGTVIVQAVAGIGRSYVLFLSSLLAGIIWVKLKPLVTKEQASLANGENSTVMAVTGFSAGSTVLTYILAMISGISVVLALAPRSPALVHPVIGGLLIGLGQLSSVLLAGKAVGVSSAYEDFGKLFWKGKEGKMPASLPDSVLFVLGIMCGALVTMVGVPATKEALYREDDVSFASALVGGLLLTFGARIAGGCTSGHGISGMASMGLSSFISVAAMFGTGLIMGSLVQI